MADLAAIGARVRLWRENPRAFAYDELKFEFDPWQDEVLRVFPSQEPDKLRMSLQACTGPGKTAVMAVCNLNFISCYGSKGEHPQGLCTSITEDNLDANLWKELARWQLRSEYLRVAFRWTATRFASVDHPATWFLESRSWSRRADPETLGRTLSGLHAKDVMVTIDEAGDVPVPILRSGEQIFSSAYRWAKLLQGGNPTSLEGALHHAAVRARQMWYIVRVTGDPDDPKCAQRVNKDANRQQIALYGRDNPWVQSTILGQFPPASINALLSVEEVQAAMDRHLRRDQYDWSQKRLGVDVARFGDDRTVIFPRQGLASFRPAVMRNARTTDIAARVIAAMHRWGAELPLIDDTGHWGHGVIDNLVTAGIPAIGVNFAGKALNPRYKNRRAEMWLKGTEMIRAGGALPNVPELVAELTEPTYTFVAGQFMLEEKDQIKKRLGRSPDLADAYMLTHAIEDMPSDMHDRLRSRQRAQTEFDPYAMPGEGAALVGVGRTTHDFDPTEDG